MFQFLFDFIRPLDTLIIHNIYLSIDFKFINNPKIDQQVASISICRSSLIITPLILGFVESSASPGLYLPGVD